MPRTETPTTSTTQTGLPDMPNENVVGLNDASSEDRTAHLRERARRMATDVRERSLRGAERAKETVKAHPRISTGVALVAGLALGALLVSRSPRARAKLASAGMMAATQGRRLGHNLSHGRLHRTPWEKARDYLDHELTGFRAEASRVLADLRERRAA
ncbi:hypothetical protein Q0812_01355 [Brevundimonas sp. 2R-24]|uniref:DUF3618 domain-containing protein n=1 Tax=Peiella sedimenti TaxID=3061083 RepID=A0ABT8SHM7_9CAUL|nr:hypothetical protein [Caulobacteraceae bacterium XZ-24]